MKDNPSNFDTTLICYASGRFIDYQDGLIDTAKSVGGVRRALRYTKRTIPEEYRKKHLSIFSQTRGDGYWLWKPYIIERELLRLPAGSFLLYCDSACEVINSLNPLFELAKNARCGVVCFELPYPEKQYTKREVFDVLNMDILEHGETPQRLASYICFRVCSESIAFVKRWKELCEVPLLLTDLPSRNSECSEFIEHRHDQSLFSMLTKNFSIPAFTDPSQLGNTCSVRFGNYTQLINHHRGVNATLSPRLSARMRRFWRIIKIKIRYEVSKFVK
jgi:hypothetical protein